MHPLLDDAARGVLPSWARISDKRRDHVRRVAALLAEWATVLAPEDVGLWHASGLLHDALKDAPAAELRGLAAPEQRDWAEPLLHAAAIANVLRNEGVADESVLLAVNYHPIGNKDFALVGRALYTADFIEPGRKYERKWLSTLRARMPHEMSEVLFEVTAVRMHKQIEEGRPLRSETLEFWNAQVAARAA